ncbi:MAG: hypothetical protein MJK18_05010, partial [Bdellovibrionales bacterium]|nr:hypothetical protein [Bdellovibrionales bacterium]
MKTLVLISIFIFSTIALAEELTTPVELSAKRTASFDTYERVWQRVNYQKFDKDSLPHYVGVENDDLIELVINNYLKSDTDLSPDWPFTVRTRELFTNSSNFNANPGVKWLHPRGACVSGTWVIPEDSPSTAAGLFAPGTRVPMIMRISTGTHDSQRRTEEGEIQARIFGLAIKLFHQTDVTAKAITSNIVTLDHRGFSRSDRPYALIPKAGKELYYTNFAPVESLVGS